MVRDVSHGTHHMINPSRSSPAFSTASDKSWVWRPGNEARKMVMFAQAVDRYQVVFSHPTHDLGMRLGNSVATPVLTAAIKSTEVKSHGNNVCGVITAHNYDECRRTNQQTNKHRKCKAIFGPAGCMLCMQPAGI